MNAPPKEFLKLSALNANIQSVLSNAFGGRQYWVVADVTSHSFRQAKSYHYFDLVEKSAWSGDIVAKMSATAWGNGSLQIARFERATGQPFTNNIQVLVKVTVEFHVLYGLRLNLVDIDPAYTLGQLEKQKQATLEKLLAENPGFIDRIDEVFVTANKRLSLPAVIQRVALITSQHSAGGEDFRHTLAHNQHGYQFYIDEYPSGVQGEQQAQQLIAQLIAVFTSGKAYDAVVIVRGGGAQTDLLMFDNYLLAKAIAKFPVPVLTGIGHQRDETIADLMAHTSMKTPTRVAEFIISRNRLFEDNLLDWEKSIVIRTQQTMAQHRHELQALAGLLTSRPAAMLQQQSASLVYLAASLQANARNFLRNSNAAILQHQALIRAFSPVNLLKKGFAMVRLNGKLQLNAKKLTAGTEFELLMADSKLTAVVSEKNDTMEEILSYEAAYAELQQIAADIENESVSVDTLAEKVNRAAVLINYCQGRLRATEKEVNGIIAQMQKASGR